MLAWSLNTEYVLGGMSGVVTEDQQCSHWSTGQVTLKRGQSKLIGLALLTGLLTETSKLGDFPINWIIARYSD